MKASHKAAAIAVSLLAVSGAAGEAQQTPKRGGTLTVRLLINEQIAVQLLGLLGPRKNELRLLQIKDFDVGKGTLIVHGKGQKVVVMDIAIPSLKDDLNLELMTRNRDEYPLYPRSRTTDPLDPASLHGWHKSPEAGRTSGIHQDARASALIGGQSLPRDR